MSWIDDLNNRADVDQDIYDQMKKLYRMEQMAGKRKTQQAQSKDDGFQLTDLLPTGGGIAGSLGGAAAGAAAGSVVPGLGTAVGGLLGAILGGAGGSALGKVGENAAEGEQDLSKGVAGEALLGGATSLPITGAFKLARAGGALAKGSKEAAGQLVKEAGAGAIPKMAGGLQARAAEEAGQAARVLPGASMAGGEAGQTLKTSASGRLTDLGNKALKSQYGTIRSPVARSTDPEGTVGALADMGILKPADAERVAGEITGSGGLLNRTVVNAVGKSGGVDTSSLRQVFDDALDSYGIVDADRRSLQQVFDSQMKKVTGGARGSLSPTANPSDALDMMKALEKRMADLTGKGSNYRLTTPERGDKANVLRLVRDELEEKLYGGAQGANAQLSGVLTPELRGQLIDIMPNNARWQQFVDNQIMGARDVAGLRSAQRPFVNIKKIIEDAEANDMTFGGKAGNAVGGIKDAVVSAGTALVKNPAARASGQVLRAAGGRTPGPASSAAGQSIMGAAARQGVPRGLEGALNAPAPAPMLDENGLAAEDYETLAAEGFGPAGGEAGPMAAQEAANPFGVSQDEVAAAMVQALNSGDVKGFDNLSQLYKIMQDSAAAGTGDPLSASAQKNITNAQSGLQSLNDVEAMLRNDPGLVTRASAPDIGGLNSLLGTSQYRAAITNVQDAMARLRTGAAMTAGEQQRFERMLPRFGDSPQDIQYKIGQFRDFYQNVIQGARAGGGSGGLEEALLAGGM